jgi:hypothetical protein
MRPTDNEAAFPLYGFRTTGRMNQKSGLRQHRAQTREDEDVFLWDRPLVGRPFVARIPLSTGAGFCFSSAQGCLFR